MFLHNLLNVLVQIANKMGLQKKVLSPNEKLRGLSPRANYTDRATAACRRVSANFYGERVPRGQSDGFLRPYSRFSRPDYLLIIVYYK
jgi:hypothetical protein